MGIKDIFSKIKSPSDEEAGEGESFMEVGEESEANKINVRIETLKTYSDVDRVQDMVRDSNVVFLRIRELRDKDINELKRAVEKLKKTCTAVDGDMVGVDEDFLIITPKIARVYRGKAA
jgi:SepF-like predicted cell division protein (DUF552 family)